MAKKPIKIRIEANKLLKQHIYTGKQRADGTTPKYINLVAWERTDGVGQFGDTHSVKQEISREAREAGEQEPFVGSLTMPDEGARPAPRTTAAKVAARSDAGQSSGQMEEDDIPF